MVKQHAKLGRLENNRASHKQRGNKSGVSFIERIIKGTHTKSDAEWRAAHLGYHALRDGKP